ncbi:MAG: iron-sulfur cluster carrier protein ApbC [Candidatus Zixiibacteriota bacterium]|nr:MAG: iron-sulfur cluster carrier protein ApbC [candidate division Zixibacteria bacterium]
MSSSNASKSSVMDILKQVKYPGYSRDIVSFGMVKGIQVDDGRLTVSLGLVNVDPAVSEQIRNEAVAALRRKSGFTQVEVQVVNPAAESAPQAAESQKTLDPQPIPGVQRIVAVSSGKGGVGKSTVAVNLAACAAQAGLKVGLLDADVYGPSLPTLLNVRHLPDASEKGLIPVEKFGMKTMSIGYLVDRGQPLIWRGPMVHKALEQMAGDTHWGALDVLFMDLPPGTGDVQLTLAQKFRIDGALVVTTPQDIALEDVRRGAIMFQKVNIPVLGVVENMSYYTCVHCGNVSHPFGEGGGEREAKNLSLPLLGRLPLDPRIRVHSDEGVPVVVADPFSEASKAYLALWEEVRKCLM